MSFRTVIIKNRSKLEYSLNYLVYRGVNSEKRICLNEISTLLIQSTEVSITSALLANLIEKKIKVIFCDSLNNPCSELIPYYGTYDSYDKIIRQFNFEQNIKDILWKEIIKEKILRQANNLKFYHKDKSYEMLMFYRDNVTIGDSSNREGHAAKVYFNSLFGSDFNRSKEIETNCFLNYGYSIILSCINREVKIAGYLTEIGIHHIGVTNPFNFSCDLIEPLRPLVDYYIISKKVNTDNFKKVFVELLNLKVIIENKTMYLENAVRVYIQSCINCLLNKDVSQIKFIEYVQG